MKRFITVVSVLLSVAACSGSDKAAGPDEITIADLVGSWTASSLTFTNNGNPGQKLDLIALGGENRMTVLDGGRARTWLEFGTFSDEWDAQLTISGNTLTSQPAEASRGVQTWTFSLEGNVLELSDTSSEFDFTLAGGDAVPATLVVVLIRQ